MKKLTLLSIIAILSFSATGIIFHALNFGEKNDSTSFSTIIIQKRTIEQAVTATGIVKPKVGAEVKVGAQVSGIVKKLFVEIGSKVKKGQILAEIEPTGYQAKVDMALAEKEIAGTEKSYNEVELNRSRNLLESGAITRQQFDNAEKLYKLSSSKLVQAKADLEYASLQLGYTKITAPIDGIISSVTTQEGETVTASFASPTFVTIIDLKRLEVWAYVDETDIGRIRNTQKVSFTVDTYPGNEFKGSVETIYPKAEIQNNVVNYVTVINVEKQEDKIIRPEMTATVRIISGKKENVLSLPKSAVKKEDGKTFVYLLQKGSPEKRFIETGISDKNFYEIISGINGNESVITGELPNN